jgi:nucleoside-diphosphate-sugar epimerase
VVKANILSLKFRGFGIFNIGTGTKTMINDLAGKIAQLLKAEIRPVYSKSRKGDVRDSLSDISAAKKALGFKYSYSIDSGLKETLKSYL